VLTIHNHLYVSLDAAPPLWLKQKAGSAERIFGPKRDEWRKVQCEELHGLNCSPCETELIEKGGYNERDAGNVWKANVYVTFGGGGATWKVCD
jgi:hypothetical protein